MRAVEAGGGTVPEMQPGFPPIEPQRSIAAFGENVGDYLLWQLYDIPYASLNLLAQAIAIGLGLRALGGGGPLRWILLAPGVYFVMEMIENALVAGFVSGAISPTEPFVLVQQLATTLKLAAGWGSMAAGIAGLVIAAAIGVYRKIRKQ